MSQAKLAGALGLDRSHLSKIESGAIGLPEKDTRNRFHELFDTSEQELIDYGIVPVFDTWGRRIDPAKPDVRRDDEGIPVRNVKDDMVDPDDLDDSPLTEEEEDALKDVMFHGLAGLSNADLRDVIAILKRSRAR